MKSVKASLPDNITSTYLITVISQRDGRLLDNKCALNEEMAIEYCRHNYSLTSEEMTQLRESGFVYFGENHVRKVRIAHEYLINHASLHGHK